MSHLHCNCLTFHTVCMSDEWACDTGQCIYAPYRCDGHPNDCQDGSDENECCESVSNESWSRELGMRHT